MDLNPISLWNQMTILNKGVIVILILLSIWSLYVSVERLIMFSKARKQSLAFAKQATEHLKNDRPQACNRSSTRARPARSPSRRSSRPPAAPSSAPPC